MADNRSIQIDRNEHNIAIVYSISDECSDGSMQIYDSSINIPSTASDWLSLSSIADNRITLKAKSNPNEADRGTIVTIEPFINGERCSGFNAAQVTIVQKGFGVTCACSSLTSSYLDGLTIPANAMQSYNIYNFDSACKDLFTFEVDGTVEETIKNSNSFNISAKQNTSIFLDNNITIKPYFNNELCNDKVVNIKQLHATPLLIDCCQFLSKVLSQSDTIIPYSGRTTDINLYNIGRSGCSFTTSVFINGFQSSTDGIIDINTSANPIKITKIYENNTGSDRIFTIKAKNNGIECENSDITITQLAKTSFSCSSISRAQEKFYVPQAGGTITAYTVQNESDFNNFVFVETEGTINNDGSPFLDSDGRSVLIKFKENNTQQTISGTCTPKLTSSDEECESGKTIYIEQYMGAVACSEYLTFEITEKLTVDPADWGTAIYWTNRTTSGKLYASLDKGATWQEVPNASTEHGEQRLNVDSLNVGDVIYFKGELMPNEVPGYQASPGIGTFTTSNLKFKVSGNPLSLLYGDFFADKTKFPSKASGTGEIDGPFVNLFMNCTGLTDASGIKLVPATLTKYCYYGMFYDCNNLVEGPELPATTLAEGCYGYMFADTNLTSLPILSATKMEKDCYSNMFGGCSGITSLSWNYLPSTELASGCYAGMFGGTKLTSVPSGLLPATVLADQCYSSMFAGCSGITSVPSDLLAAQYVPMLAYAYMFNGTSITTPPNLPATVLGNSCYKQMFENCRNLTETPSLPATTLAEGCYTYMFHDCTSLTSTTATTLSATTLTKYCYNGMFKGCSALETAPELQVTKMADYSCGEMFCDCISLNYIKCLSTDISAYQCTNDWVFNVAENGTFVKKNGVTWPIGNDGIPGIDEDNKWTVQNES